jgi:hypothetical protein
MTAEVRLTLRDRDPGHWVWEKCPWILSGAFEINSYCKVTRVSILVRQEAENILLLGSKKKRKKNKRKKKEKTKYEVLPATCLPSLIHHCIHSPNTNTGLASH